MFGIRNKNNINQLPYQSSSKLGREGMSDEEDQVNYDSEEDGPINNFDYDKIRYRIKAKKVQESG